MHFQAWSCFEPLGERQSLLCRCGAAYSSKINVTLNLLRNHAWHSWTCYCTISHWYAILSTYISLSLVLHHQMDIGWRAILLIRRLETRYLPIPYTIVCHILYRFSTYIDSVDSGYDCASICFSVWWVPSVQLKDYIAPICQRREVHSLFGSQNSANSDGFIQLIWIPVASANRSNLQHYHGLNAFVRPIQFSFLCGHLRLLQQGYLLQYGAEGKVIGFGSHFSIFFLSSWCIGLRPHLRPSKLADGRDLERVVSHVSLVWAFKRFFSMAWFRMDSYRVLSEFC